MLARHSQLGLSFHKVYLNISVLISSGFVDITFEPMHKGSSGAGAGIFLAVRIDFVLVQVREVVEVTH